MKKRFIGFAAIIIIGIAFLYYFDWLPIVLIGEKSTLNNRGNLEKKRIFKPLEEIDFKEESIAYFIFSKDDLNELPQKIIRNKVLYCDSRDILSKMKRYFVFSSSTGDMTTCESKIVVYNNHKKIFQSSIIVKPNLVGIQNEITGWAEARYQNELIDIFSSFKKSKALFLNFE